MEKPINQYQNQQNIPISQNQQNYSQNQRYLQIYNQNNQYYNIQTADRMLPNQNMAYIYSPQQINPIPTFGGIQYIFTTDPLSDINSCSGVLIKQEPELIEMLTGFQTPNRYHVFGKTNNGYIYLFKCLEKSTCCMRFCCDPSLREFNMDILHVGSGFANLFANIYKPFKCVCCGCCERPEMIVKLNNGENVGKILNPFHCCDPEYNVFDSNDQLKYFVTGEYCQCGLCCSSSICGKCSKANFFIFDKKFGNQIGLLTKNEAQCVEIISNADSYSIEFPSSANAKEKLLLICLGLMIDYQHFEHNNSQNNRNGMRIRF